MKQQALLFGLALIAASAALVPMRAHAAPTPAIPLFTELLDQQQDHFVLNRRTRQLVTATGASAAVGVASKLLSHARSATSAIVRQEPGDDDPPSNLTTAWDRLAEMTDTFGPRPGGSQALEQSIDWMVEQAKKDGFEVHTEDVPIPFWKRGQEYATLTTPTWTTNLSLVGLGFSAPTPPQGIDAPVYVVKDRAQLDEAGERGDLKGKIVLINHAWESYGVGSAYRSSAALWAEKWGAVAALIQSVTPYSMRTPHTGGSKRAGIPAAALAVEDANIIARIFARSKGQQPRIRLYMESESGDAVSRNVVVDLPGADPVLAKDVVLFGGHIDSWDKGVGAQDDGIGMMTMYQAIYLLKHAVKFTPRRTLRVVFFTAEETGIFGGNAYFEAHAKDTNVVSAIESDTGVFTPWGLTLGGQLLTDAALRQFEAIGENIRDNGGRGWRVKRGYAGADVEKWCVQAVCGSWVSATGDDVYFRYHHTAADMMDAINPLDAEEAAATVAIYAAALSG
ncbi:hypothetical protein BCR44DRAFT_49935 [Catenaria anguillulae PL171]|uniref:Peptide hydrolase n=1 Tax=Catenaria anguillulae PL171 TaxID=765915 RepID=A0A1Y2H535_9FUNG|nr:hypothetical protein BCR44DRAFT_49935 [Catenaria anguillulae PL171]